MTLGHLRLCTSARQATDALHAKVDDLAGLALSAGADAAAVRAIKDRSLARGQCT